MTIEGQPSAGAHMRSEIAEQPARWQDLISQQQPAFLKAAELFRTVNPELLVFAARGSSDHAAMYGQYLAHNLLGIPALLSTPSTVTAFGTELRYPTSIMLAVSQSGESPDLLDTVRAAKRGGVPVIALTNHESSTLAALSDVHVSLMAGPELSVAATKTYTAELLALYVVLRLAAGGSWNEIQTRANGAIETATRVIDRATSWAEQLAETLQDTNKVLLVGRGYSMSTAKEGALKLMETNSIAASGWSAADATHGPLGQVEPGTPVIAFTSSPGGRESVHAFAEAARALGGRLIVIGPRGTDDAENLEIQAAAGSALDPALLPLMEIIPLQQLALCLALRRGMDPDRPAGLKKVTKTV
ncbi:SIS domain-containing protein [Arthrobacter sp. NPDC056691]|uniref:SIS domain-containing protein n=1 Tax=Arthrobacter sp. NPDC056691 TaxID=3345913 RepID=UPI00366D28D9